MTPEGQWKESLSKEVRWLLRGVLYTATENPLSSRFLSLSPSHRLCSSPPRRVSLSLSLSSSSPMFLQESYESGTAAAALQSFPSQRDVTYSCGYCGYALNLSSSNRNTNNIGSKYGKAIKKGVVSFFLIDESRFSQTDELRCLPYFNSKNSWGLFRRRTRLLCRKCGSYIGSAYEENSPPICSDNSDSSSTNGTSAWKKYNIKINALQPSSDDSGIPLVT